jgi:hypothetical protein
MKDQEEPIIHWSAFGAFVISIGTSAVRFVDVVLHRKEGMVIGVGGSGLGELF